MNKFSFYDAATVEEAIGQVSSTVSETIQPGASPDASVFKAGGIDVLDLMKEGIPRPGKLVNVCNVEGLGAIEYDEKNGLRIGSNATLAELATDTRIKDE